MWAYRFIRLVVLVCCFLFLLLAGCVPEGETVVPVTRTRATATTTAAATFTLAATVPTATVAVPTTQPTTLPTLEPIDPSFDNPGPASGQAQATTQPSIVEDMPLPVREEMSFNVVAQLGGGVNAVALEGNIAYVGVGPRLVTVDISDAAAPRFLGQSDTLPEMVQAVAVQAGLAYVGSNDLYIYDVSGPATPVLISKLADLQGCFITDIIVAGDVVYIRDTCENLIAIDVSDLERPVRVGTRSQAGTAITLIRDMLYVAAGGKLQQVDIATLDNASGEIQLDPPLFAPEMAATDEALFLVAAGDDWSDCALSFLQVIDISDTVPRTAAEFDPHSCVNDMAAAGDTLLVATGRGLQIYDAGDPANLALAGEFVHPAGFNDVEKIALNGDVAYIFSTEGGNARLHVLDLARPGVPVLTGDTLDLRAVWDPSWGVSGLYVRGNKLFLQFYGGLIAMDISRPASPLLMGFYDWLSVPAVVGNVLYKPIDGGLDIVDVSDPANPVLIDTILSEGVSVWSRLETVDDYLIIGVHLYDVSDPLRPVEVGRLDVLGSIFAVVEDTIYTSDLYVVDIADPAHPTVIDRFTSRQLFDPVEMVPAGDTIYIRDSPSERGVWAMNVGDRFQPYLAGHLQLPYFGEIHNVGVDGDLLYVAAGDYGLVIVQAAK